MSSIKGFLFGASSSALFGLMPLFTLPLFEWGMTFHSVLFYRFLFATGAMALLLVVKKISFKVTLPQLLILILLGAFYVVSALFLYWGYMIMSSGTATTLHFTYPIFVTILMMVLYRERFSLAKFIAILLAIVGVAFLSSGGKQAITLSGLAIVVLSAIGYAVYIITVNKSRVRTMNGMAMTFYVLAAGTVLFFIIACCNGEISPIDTFPKWSNILLLALVPTIFSNLCLVRAIRLIGSTLTAVLGALEPLTAVCVGILFFQEQVTLSLSVGILLILVSVMLIVALPYLHFPQKKIWQKWLSIALYQKRM